MNKPGIFNVAVAAIIEKENKILITKRSSNRDHAPNEWEAGITGRLNQGETYEEALIREVKEELNIEVALIIPFKTFHFFRGKDKAEHQGVNFWKVYKSGEIILDMIEQVEYKWVFPEEALQYVADTSVIEEVEAFIEFKKHYQLN